VEHASDERRPIRAVLCDAGGVLVFPNLDWLSAGAARLEVRAEGGTPLRPDRGALLEGYYRTIFDVETELAELVQGPAFRTVEIRRWFFGKMLRHAGAAPGEATRVAEALATEAATTFPRESDIYHFAMPGLRERLERIRAAGLFLGAASNNDGALEAQLESAGVRDLFGALKDSGIEGVAKPDPELLLRAARALGVEPADCLYVGDVDRIDGEAARRAGMSFALLDPLSQARPSRALVINDLDRIHDHFRAETNRREHGGNP
jgi:HAD superfamily hydrolase (TIGR01549 family)